MNIIKYLSIIRLRNDMRNQKSKIGSFSNRTPRSMRFMLLFILLISKQSMADYSFIPTESEFASWSLRCKALYVSLGVAETTVFAYMVPREEVDFYRTKYNALGGGPWHYCEGLLHLRRAKREFRNKEIRARHLGAAHAGVIYTLRGLNKSHPWYAEMAVTMGLIYKEKKDIKNAHRFFDRAIKAFPKYLPAYTAKALLLRDSGEIEEAIKLLTNTSKSIEGNLAEVHYFLGTFLLANGNIEKANEYAKKAYKEGYPLLGLKNKLKSIKNN